MKAYLGKQNQRICHHQTNTKEIVKKVLQPEETDFTEMNKELGTWPEHMHKYINTKEMDPKRYCCDLCPRVSCRPFSLGVLW